MNLTSLANAKTYLAITGSAVDARLSELIARESAMVERWTSRHFGAATYTRRFTGTNGPVLTLPETPILSVGAVNVLGVAIEPSPSPEKYGYVFDPDTPALYMIGGTWASTLLGISITWDAGWRTASTANVPTANVPTLVPSEGGYAAQDVGVAYAANGSVLASVASGPLVGQYSFSDGVYTFSADDAGNAVTMTYGYVPGPVEQATIEMVGMDLKIRDNIGINSKTLAGETVSYSGGGLTQSCKDMLQPYKRLAPV